MSREVPTSKACARCGLERPASEYTGQPRNADGLRSWCKPCVAERNREYRAPKRAIRRAAADPQPERRRTSWTAQRRYLTAQALETHDRTGDL